MFKEMRRKAKLMSKEETIKTLGEASFGNLATYGENGFPYVVPLNFAFREDTIYFHCALQGQKIENIRKNNKVSFSAVTYNKVNPDKFDTEYDSVIVFGEAVEITDRDEKKGALMVLLERYSPDYLEKGREYIERDVDRTGVFKIVIQHMTGKKSR